jgi:hypothetical protein
MLYNTNKCIILSFMHTAFYMAATYFDVISLSFSGSWHQIIFKTYSNKIGNNKHTYVVVSLVRRLHVLAKIIYINITQCWWNSNDNTLCSLTWLKIIHFYVVIIFFVYKHRFFFDPNLIPSLYGVYCMVCGGCVILLHVPGDRSNRSSPSFPSTAFQNSSGICELLSGSAPYTAIHIISLL